MTEDQQPSAEERYGRMRRRDRLVEDEAWIRSYLCGAAFGVMATAREHQPSMIPNTFVYDEQAHAIYIHTGRQSRLRENIEANDRACFCVSEMGRLLPAKEAIEFSVEYTSVVAYGRASIVEDEAEMERALQALLDKYFPHLRPGPDYHPITRDELARTSVYRLGIEHWSAKRNEQPPDFPGASPSGIPRTRRDNARAHLERRGAVSYQPSAVSYRLRASRSACELARNPLRNKRLRAWRHAGLGIATGAATRAAG